MIGAAAEADVAPRRPSVPWRVNDVIALYVANLLGATCITLAWWGAGGAARFADQLGWAQLGIGGLVVAGSGNALWLLHGRGAVGRRRAALLAPFGPASLGPSSVPAQPEAPDLAGRHQLVAGANMRRYHRADCQLVIGKQVQVASRSSHERHGRTPCGVCTP